MTTPEFYSLYVHIPFCTAKCTYCDFNSYAGQDSLMAPYSEAVAREARLWSGHMRDRQAVTIFFGGGTPSLLPLPEMRVILEALRECFDIAPDAEVTLEANPGTVDAAHLAGLRSLGFNRISFGVQSFHDDELRTLERIHDGYGIGIGLLQFGRQGRQDLVPGQSPVDCRQHQGQFYRFKQLLAGGKPGPGLQVSITQFT